MYVLSRLLWVDCTAGALAGAAMLVLSGWLTRPYALPHGLLVLMGAVNLLYAAYSLSLAVLARRPKGLVNLLVFANGTWAAVCLGWAVVFAESASPFGLGHLVGEALLVGGLAGLEWRYRDLLLKAPDL